jgi:dTDP-4-dehydrorhamnose reductase
MNSDVAIVKVIVLGASGMLGSMVLDFLRREKSFDVVGTARNDRLIEEMSAKTPNVQWHSFEAENCRTEDIQQLLTTGSWVINAIGVIKPYVHDDNPYETQRAVRINSLFPYVLARAAENNGCKVAQIATDCVYSGSRGNYVETDRHDPLDVYGKTKSLGEVFATNFFHLRCSLIGPEPKAHASLLDWFLNQKSRAAINGYLNHGWNGITTLHFAKLLSGIIKADQTLPHVQHIIPADHVSKHELLLLFARYYKKDVDIRQSQASLSINRTLNTLDETLNHALWGQAGYSEPPSIAAMVEELADYEYPFAAAGT